MIAKQATACAYFIKNNVLKCCFFLKILNLILFEQIFFCYDINYIIPLTILRIHLYIWIISHLNYVTFKLCIFWLLSLFATVTFELCHICIMSLLTSVTFEFGHIWLLLHLNYVTFELCPLYDYCNFWLLSLLTTVTLSTHFWLHLN